MLQLLRFLELRVKIFRRDRPAPETHESGFVALMRKVKGVGHLVCPHRYDHSESSLVARVGGASRQFCCNPEYPGARFYVTVTSISVADALSELLLYNYEDSYGKSQLRVRICNMHPV